MMVVGVRIRALGAFVLALVVTASLLVAAPARAVTLGVADPEGIPEGYNVDVPIVVVDESAVFVNSVTTHAVYDEGNGDADVTSFFDLVSASGTTANLTVFTALPASTYRIELTTALDVVTEAWFYVDGFPGAWAMDSGSRCPAVDTVTFESYPPLFESPDFDPAEVVVRDATASQVPGVAAAVDVDGLLNLTIDPVPPAGEYTVSFISYGLDFETSFSFDDCIVYAEPSTLYTGSVAGTTIRLPDTSGGLVFDGVSETLTVFDGTETEVPGALNVTGIDTSSVLLAAFPTELPVDYYTIAGTDANGRQFSSNFSIEDPVLYVYPADFVAGYPQTDVYVDGGGAIVLDGTSTFDVLEAGTDSVVTGFADLAYDTSLSTVTLPPGLPLGAYDLRATTGSAEARALLTVHEPVFTYLEFSCVDVNCWEQLFVGSTTGASVYASLDAEVFDDDTTTVEIRDAGDGLVVSYDAIEVGAWGTGLNFTLDQELPLGEYTLIALTPGQPTITGTFSVVEPYIEIYPQQLFDVDFESLPVGMWGYPQGIDLSGASSLTATLYDPNNNVVPGALQNIVVNEWGDEVTFDLMNGLADGVHRAVFDADGTQLEGTFEVNPPVITMVDEVPPGYTAPITLEVTGESTDFLTNPPTIEILDESYEPIVGAVGSITPTSATTFTFELLAQLEPGFYEVTVFYDGRELWAGLDVLAPYIESVVPGLLDVEDTPPFDFDVTGIGTNWDGTTTVDLRQFEAETPVPITELLVATPTALSFRVPGDLEPGCYDLTITTGEEIVTWWCAISREGPSISLDEYSLYIDYAVPYEMRAFGRGTDLVAPVSVEVRDFETGTPIAGAVSGVSLNAAEQIVTFSLDLELAPDEYIVVVSDTDETYDSSFWVNGPSLEISPDVLSVGYGAPRTMTATYRARDVLPATLPSVTIDPGGIDDSDAFSVTPTRTGDKTFTFEIPELGQGDYLVTLDLAEPVSGWFWVDTAWLTQLDDVYVGHTRPFSVDFEAFVPAFPSGALLDATLIDGDPYADRSDEIVSVVRLDDSSIRITFDGTFSAGWYYLEVFADGDHVASGHLAVYEPQVTISPYSVPADFSAPFGLTAELLSSGGWPEIPTASMYDGDGIEVLGAIDNVAIDSGDASVVTMDLVAEGLLDVGVYRIDLTTVDFTVTDYVTVTPGQATLTPDTLFTNATFPTTMMLEAVGAGFDGTTVVTVTDPAMTSSTYPVVTNTVPAIDGDSLTFDLGALSAGTYWVVAETGGQQVYDWLYLDDPYFFVYPWKLDTTMFPVTLYGDVGGSGIDPSNPVVTVRDDTDTEVPGVVLDVRVTNTWSDDAHSLQIDLDALPVGNYTLHAGPLSRAIEVTEPTLTVIPTDVAAGYPAGTAVTLVTNGTFFTSNAAVSIIRLSDESEAGTGTAVRVNDTSARLVLPTDLTAGGYLLEATVGDTTIAGRLFVIDVTMSSAPSALKVGATVPRLLTLKLYGGPDFDDAGTVGLYDKATGTKQGVLSDYLASGVPDWWTHAEATVKLNSLPAVGSYEIRYLSSDGSVRAAAPFTVLPADAPPQTTVTPPATGSVTTDPDTGEPVVSMPSGSPSDVTVSRAFSCADTSQPDSVTLLYAGRPYAMTLASGVWSVTIPGSDIASGGTSDLTYQVVCGSDTTSEPGGKIVLFDPSGIITDADTGDEVVGASVTLWQVDGYTPDADGTIGATECESNVTHVKGTAWTQPAVTSAKKVPTSGHYDPGVLVQVTGADGRYGWDVAYGCWYVTVTAPGYEDLISPMVGVGEPAGDPEVTDLDLELTPTAVANTAPTWPAGSKVTATASSPTSVSLSWTAATDDVGVAGYRVFRNGVQVGGNRPASPRTFTDTGLSPETTYTYEVRAFDGALLVSTGNPKVGVTTPAADVGGGGDGGGGALNGLFRLFGGDRYATAAAIALDRFDPTEVTTVFIATGGNFPDALTGGPLAAALGAPILLVSDSAVPEATINALDVLQPSKVVALGGENTVSQELLERAAQVSGATTARLWGIDRFATAAAIARSMPGDIETVYLATAGNFPDALAAGAVADGAPILLVTPDTLPTATAQVLGDLRPAKVVALGGTNSISGAVLAAAVAAAEGAVGTRVWGADRYATAAAVADLAGADVTTVYIATGENFPDALAGGPAAAMEGAPLLLVKSGEVPQATKDWLAKHGVTRIVILGGESTVGANVRQELLGYL